MTGAIIKSATGAVTGFERQMLITTSEVVPANRFVKVEFRVSVKIRVPTTNPTPSTMATPERTRRSLW